MRREGLVIGLVGLLSTAITWQPAWSADRYVLVTGFLSGNIVRFDLSTGAAEQVIALQPSSGGDTGDRPRGIVVGGDSLIYVALRGGTKNVRRFTWNGAFVDNFTQSIGVYGPGQIGFSDDGNLIVGGDASNQSSVFRYDGNTGTLIDTFRLTGFTNVVGLLVHGSIVYSAAYFSANVARYDLTQVPVVGVPFVYSNGLVRLIGMTVGHTGNLFVGSASNGIVQEYDINTGALVGTFLDLGGAVVDIKYDPRSRLYYVTQGGSSVLEFDETGTLLRTLQSDLLNNAYSLTLAVLGPSDGACCGPEGACTVTAQAACPNPSIWQGEWTNCTPDPCPPAGACCHDDGACTYMIQENCLSPAVWQGNGTLCEPNPCPQPPAIGSCCAPDGSCTLTTQAACTGIWTEANGCHPNTCVQSDGSCCALDGTCAVTKLVDCTGSWAMFGVCDPTPCPQPTGACCEPTGLCTLVPVQGCPEPSIWQGAETICNPNPCLSGACCLRSEDWTCEIHTLTQCALYWGIYQGNGALCDPNPCPALAEVDGGHPDISRLQVHTAPNPSAGGVVIGCLLPLRAQTTVMLFDASGRIVRRLHEGDLPAGETPFSWDGRDDAGREVPAGVYLVKVSTPAEETSGRVVLTR